MKKHNKTKKHIKPITKTEPKPKPNKNKELLKDIGRGLMSTAELVFIIFLNFFKWVMRMSEKFFIKMKDKSTKENGTKNNNDKPSKWQ